MPAPRKYDQETRDRAVRMYKERRRDFPDEAFRKSSSEHRFENGGAVVRRLVRSYAVEMTSNNSSAPTLEAGT